MLKRRPIIEITDRELGPPSAAGARNSLRPELFFDGSASLNVDQADCVGGVSLPLETVSSGPFRIADERA